MELKDGVNRINGIVQVQIEGFFTERFINLCKINNIKIWDIKNLVNGIVRFNVSIKDFKKLKKISKKTKCKMSIISKKGLYFKLFKLRKRKLILLLASIFIAICIFSTTFIWSVNISGNTYISTEKINRVLKSSGLYVGKNKIGFKSKKIINNLRVEIPDIAWAGIEIDGTNVYVKIVEKTRLPSNAIFETSIGDIVSDKSGVIEKIIVENGTPILSVGDYVEEGRILIEGKVYSEFLDTKDVTAKGTIILKTNYEYKKEYEYVTQEKEYTGKVKYNIGIGINDKENYINYLDKSIKYDIIKSSSDIKFMKNKLSFILYKYNIYTTKEISRTKDEIMNIANIEAEDYLSNEILPKLRNGKEIKRDVIIENEDSNKILVKVAFEVEEEVGYFKERKTNE